jgi:Zn-dependent protease
MFGSWRIARFFGIDVGIHWTFWLLPIWVIFTYDDSAFMPLWMHLILIGCLFVCVVLHEFGHALTARQFGINTRGITLSPLGGIAQLDRMSQKPWEEFWIAIAGPLVNVAIAIILGIGLLWSYYLNPAFAATQIFQFLSVLLAMNIGLVVFNLLPVFPMDGGRVLRAILSHSMGHLQGTRIAVGIGTGLGILMGFAGFYNPMLFLIALFVVFAGQQELAALEYEERQRREAMRMTIRLWDSQIGGWVRHDIAEPR